MRGRRRIRETMFRIRRRIAGMLPTTIHYVRADAPPGGNGRSWSNAFNDLVDALDAAGPADHIWVAAGVYRPGKGSLDTNHAFRIAMDLHLLGGFAGNETRADQRDPVKNICELNGYLGEKNGRPVHCDNVVAIRPPAGRSILDGFHITGGRAERFGGGLFVYAGRPLIRRCVMRGNHAYAGAGAFVNQIPARFEDCRFENNNSVVRAGGIYVVECSPRFDRCVFEGNTSNDGAGVHTVGFEPQFHDCIFRNNRSRNRGGGSCNYVSRPRYFRCLFEGNQAGTTGGSHFDSGVGEYHECTFRGNSAANGGGGLTLDNGFLDIDRCTFENNSSEKAGGGFYNVRGYPVLNDCRFSGNRAPVASAVFTGEPEETCVVCLNNPDFVGDNADSNRDHLIAGSGVVKTGSRPSRFDPI